MARSVLVTSAALVMLAASCSGGESAAVDEEGLTWQRCGNAECTTVDVPLDRDAPEGRSISIEINRVAASDAERRLGVLLVNPGGPGGVGLPLAERIAADHPELAATFDIVGWIPRGLAGDHALGCEVGLRSFYFLDSDPDDDEEQRQLNDAAAAAAAACADDLTLLAHVGSNAVVDDMDAIRRALGEEQISYLGFSYGSVLGLGYAERYGAHLRGAVLDGVTDPADSLGEWLRSQATAADASLLRVVADSGSSLEMLDDAVVVAEAESTTAAGRPYGPSDLSRAQILATYGASTNPGFAVAIAEAGQGRIEGVVELSDAYLGAAGFNVYTAVKCLDTVHPTDPEGYAALVSDIDSEAPRLGAAIANELLPCAFWPVPSDPLPPVSDVDAPPMLVLGNLGDAATPHADAAEVVERLDKAVLVTYDGTGHLSFGRGSDCVDRHVIDYLVTLDLPPDGARCP